MYTVAIETALEENPNAQLAMIVVWGREYFDVYEMYDPELDYKTSFFFCSLDDNEWTLQIDVSKDKDRILKKERVTGKRVVSNDMQRHFLPNCSEHVIGNVPESFKPAVEQLRSNANMPSLEPIPRFMWMKSNKEVGVYWTAIFKYQDEDLTYGIMIDDAGTKMKKDDDLRYPYSWQTGDFSNYP